MSANPSNESHLPRWLVLNRNFVLLWAAYGVSAFGDHLSEMALLQEAGGLERDDITRVQALMTFFFFMPFVIFGPLAGWWADRFSRQATMIVTDILRAGIMISLSITVPWLAGFGFGDYAVALPLAATGALAAFFSPARQAMIPTLIRPDQLVRANAMISALGTIGAILSAIVGGLLVDRALAGHFELYWNYRLDALTFLVSAALLAGILMSRSRAVRHTITPGVLTPLREGFAYVWNHRRVLQIIMLGVVFWASAGVVISVVPAIVRDVFAGQFTDAGMYRGLIAAGLAVGAALLTLVGSALPIPLAVLASVTGGACWIFLLDAAVVFKLGRIFTGLCLLMIGVHGAGILVTVMVVVQRFVPDARRGRVFGVSDMCTMAAIAGATGLLGLSHIPHLDRYIPTLLTVVGVCMLATAWFAWRTYTRAQPVGPLLWLLYQISTLYIRLLARVRRVGPCTIPREGPVILAANHTAGIDPLLILVTTTRPISFVVEQKYYHRPLAGWFMRQADCIPINRDRPGKSFLEQSLRLLRRDGCLGIFPQGTYVDANSEPEPDAKVGVSVLALRSGATVVPCHISGTRYAYNPFRAYFMRHNARVRYGQPIHMSDYRGRERDKQTARDLSDLIWQRINALAPEADDET